MILLYHVWFSWARNSGRVQLDGPFNSAWQHLGPDIGGLVWSIQENWYAGSCAEVAGIAAGRIAFFSLTASLGFPTAGWSQGSWTSYMAAQGFKNECYKRSEQKMQGSLSCILLVKQVAKAGWDSKGRGLDCTLSEFSLEEKQRIFDCL